MNPFRIAFPQADLDDLNQRLAATRWPRQIPGDGWSRGVPVDYLRELAEYWRTGYDWRSHERKLNEFPQYTTEIDGYTVHFIHSRCADPDAPALLLTHSWPGSIAEFTRILGPLGEHFHLVAPSLPGFGFSEAPRETGWSLERVARMWADLMTELGYDRFGAHGNDAGALISPTLARLCPERVTGVHLTGGLGFPSDFSELTEAEQAGFAGMGELMESGAFLHTEILGKLPQTFSYGLTDSPVAQLAWIVEKFKHWTDAAADRPEDAVDRDQLLTNVTLYWLTGTAATSSWMYYEGLAGWAPSQSLVPSANLVFPNDPSLRRLAERDNKIARWTEAGAGGHFAAMEVPDLLVDDIVAFFRPA
ncbi:epoxide hydrolase family protein [Amycolatopsis sp. NPDC059657]|uniref:epoxide hydrolase family protein n=1 Tax=Amycolatopsis sp. NPDC059657 TaxID=3346899 RepID=UPI0036702606